MRQQRWQLEIPGFRPTELLSEVAASPSCSEEFFKKRNWTLLVFNIISEDKTEESGLKLG